MSRDTQGNLLYGDYSENRWTIRVKRVQFRSSPLRNGAWSCRFSSL